MPAECTTNDWHLVTSPVSDCFFLGHSGFLQNESLCLDIWFQFIYNLSGNIGLLLLGMYMSMYKQSSVFSDRDGFKAECLFDALVLHIPLQVRQHGQGAYRPSTAVDSQEARNGLLPSHWGSLSALAPLSSGSWTRSVNVPLSREESWREE